MAKQIRIDLAYRLSFQMLTARLYASTPSSNVPAAFQI